MLTVRHLTKRFGGFTAVNDVSFDLADGEILGLIGPNGSGKSTTFSVIAGLHRPTAGTIELDGVQIGGKQPNVICKLGIGRTFQIPRPFRKLSILENAEVAAFHGSTSHISTGQAHQRALDALRLVGLPADGSVDIDSLGAAGLKKLELARALATQPKILLADESLGGLDEAEMHQAADMLRHIRDQRGISIIWVEHIMGVLMKVVYRCIVLDHGEVIAEGPPVQIAHDPRVVEVYLGTDADEVQKQTSTSDAQGQAQGQVPHA